MTLGILVEVVLVIALAGFFVWLVTSLIPMPPPLPRVIGAVVCVLVLLWLLSLFGVFGGHSHWGWRGW